MLNIGQFFKRIQNKHTQELYLQEIIKGAIQKYTGMSVEFERVGSEIKIKKASAALKSHLFIKKEAILTEINSQQQTIIMTELR